MRLRYANVQLGLMTSPVDAAAAASAADDDDDDADAEWSRR